MKKVITHSGSFHADDVFAVATLQLYFGVDEVAIVRTRDEAMIASGDIVLDVGGVYDPDKQRFDHHQNGAPVRDNGIPYAAFGLIWKHYGEQVSGSSGLAAEIERRLVWPIDAADNGVSIFEVTDLGVSPALVQDVISLYKPEWGSGASMDDGFLNACALAREIISRAVTHAKANQEERDYVRSAYDSSPNRDIVVFDRQVSSINLVEYPEALVSVCPNEEGNWSAAMVRETYDSFKTKRQFPERWAGLRDQELAAASGIADAIFCHKARFLFVAKSKDGAVEAAKKALAGA